MGVLALIAVVVVLTEMLIGARSFVPPSLLGYSTQPIAFGGAISLIWAGAVGFAFVGAAPQLERFAKRPVAVLDVMLFVVSNLVMSILLILAVTPQNLAIHLSIDMVFLSAVVVVVRPLVGTVGAAFMAVLIYFASVNYGRGMPGFRIVRFLQLDGSIHWGALFAGMAVLLAVLCLLVSPRAFIVGEVDAEPSRL